MELKALTISIHTPQRGATEYREINTGLLAETQWWKGKTVEYNKLIKSCCEQCEQCAYYWENTDTENECDGEDEICHEFIEFKGIGH